MERTEIIAAIEKLRGREVHPLRIEEIGRWLDELAAHRMRVWNRSGIRGALIGFMFGPMIFGMFQVRSWGRMSITQFSAWWLLAYFVLILVLAWVYMKLQPKVGSEEHGLFKDCAGCSYPLAGLESAIGDELWVGPAVCPECGLEYPAIGK